MKRLLTSLLCAAFAVSASAALLPAGTQELGLSGGVDFDTAAGTQIDLDIFYGFFVEDSLQLGAKIGLYNDDDVTAWTIGPRMEYNFDIGIELSPYVAGSLMFATADGPEGYGDKSALIMGMEGGFKYFITEYFAISSALVLELATDDMYPSDGDSKNHDLRLEFGVRTFF
ncbi:MAG: hypothetical protein BWY59_01353 [Verrucomicrobia bacterium ADurb.Bin345]|nr:MAG: hypothetical protein BWY59_01353 [Verrucomicrobia bacterium ADurb.Bin345]